jgi:hypothetical protein
MRVSDMISDVATIKILSVDGIEPKVKDVNLSSHDTTATFVCDFGGATDIYSISWQWSANDGATWQTKSSTSSQQLYLQHITAQTEGTYIYRAKILNKICYRIYYSEPAKLHFPR